MNKRIRELTEQAETKEIGYYFFDREKFARLLVEEFSQICKMAGNESVANASDDYNEGRKMGSEVCHNMILKHFRSE